MDPETEQREQQTQEQADRLQAALSVPLPHTTTLPALSSIPSDSESQTRLLNVLVQRVDQVAKIGMEQRARDEQVLQQMIETMKLAQIMIAQQDQQQREVAEQIDRLETTAAALVKVNANLSEIVAALLDNGQKA